MTRLHSTLACALALAAAIGFGRSATAAADVDHIEHDHRLVRIGALSLHPEVLEIERDDAFGWLNYSSQIATVSFDASIIEKMLCKERNSFHRVGDRIESGNIQARQFVALCSLAPGEYEYRVRMHAGAGTLGGYVGRELSGRLVVK